MKKYNLDSKDKIKADFICIGRIVGHFGLQGYLKVEVLTDFPERFNKNKTIYIQDQPHKILDSLWNKIQVRIKIPNVNSIEDAERLRWEYIFIPASEKPKFKEGECFVSDIIGMVIIDQENIEVGIVDEILQTPAHDVIKAGDILIPALKVFVKNIDVDKKIIKVHLLPGMKEI